MEGSFIVMHSSAGAGKTHALVKRYLGRCLASANSGAYRQVLALTFTNKAAAEMRERVLRYLEQLKAGSNEGVIRALREDLVSDLGIAPDELRQRAASTLHHMLHHWSDVAIGTIDSFTRRVVQPFARDLRLDHDLRMTTDQAYYHEAAIDALLAQAGGSPALTDLLVTTCRGLIEDEEAWRVDKPLGILSAQLDKEQALEHLSALRDLGNAVFLNTEKQLRERTRAFSAQVRAYGERALKAIDDAGIGEKDMYHGSRGPLSHLRKIAAFERVLDESGANTRKALDTDQWASGTAGAQARSALQQLAPMLRRTIEEVEALRPRMREHAIALAVLRDLMPAATLHLLDDALENVKRDDGVAFFSDLTRKVSAIVREEPAPFVFERIGERYRHFLIDEFQDTSLLQWQCLLPLVENALSTGGSVLLVGDAKQAIYRWRNGEVRQFIDLPALFRRDALPNGPALERALRQHYTRGEELRHNRRSARRIIDFNNRLFTALREQLPERLRSAYDHHEQLASKDLEGLVRMIPLPEPPPEGPKAAALLTEQCVAEAIADGFAPGDIAVLVRSGTIGAQVVEHLVSLGKRVISTDGLRLAGDTGAQLVVALLGHLHHQDDLHAAKAVQLMLQAGVDIGFPDPLVPRKSRQAAKTPRAAMDHWLARHPGIGPRLPLTELIQAIVAALGWSTATDGYLLFLLEEAHAHAIEHGPDLGSFLEHWDRKGKERAVELPPDPEAIRVMTIHAAKGLQFPVVIVPVTGMQGRGNRQELIWMKPGEVVPELPSAIVRIDTTMQELDVPEVAEELDLRTFDELNLLYVAFTRPEERLYAGIDLKSSSALSTALRTFLGEPAEGPWSEGVQERHHTGAASPSGPLTATPRRPWADHLALRREAPEEWDPTDPDPDRAYGTLVHAVLATVKDSADLPAALRQLVGRGELAAEEAEALHAHLHWILAMPGMADFFGSTIEARNEVTIVDTDGHAHRPDRIVLGAEHTRVLDIKTGRPSDRHHEQVARYVALLRDLGLPNVSGHLLYTGPGRLIPVDA